MASGDYQAYRQAEAAARRVPLSVSAWRKRIREGKPTQRIRRERRS